MSNSFFIVLPSNTKSYDDNKTNKFRVHLPRKLEFDGNWVCGLHSIVYPNTWPAIGTTELQYIIVSTKSGTNIKFPIPKGSYLTPQELETTLYSGVVREVDNLKKLISEDDEVNRKRRRRDVDENLDLGPPPRAPKKAPLLAPPRAPQRVPSIVKEFEKISSEAAPERTQLPAPPRAPQRAQVPAPPRAPERAPSTIKETRAPEST